MEAVCDVTDGEGPMETRTAVSEVTDKLGSVSVEMLRLRLDTLRETQEAIKVADNKANFLVAFYTVVMFVAFPRMVDFWNWYVRAPGHALSILGFFVLAALLLSLVVSVWHFRQCARPRLDSREYVDDPMRTNIFWPDIAEHGYQGLAERLKGQCYDDVLAEVAQSLYVNSCIARRKFYHVGQCYRWLIPFVLSFVGFMMLVQAPPR